MNTEIQAIKMQHVEGAIASVILDTWKGATKKFCISFPAISVHATEKVPGGLKTFGVVDLVADGYEVLMEDPMQSNDASFHLSENEANGVTKAFLKGWDASAKLRGKVQRALQALANPLAA